MVTAHGVTHAGLVRKTNEDTLLCAVDLGLFVVADGMGGHNAGEVASKLAVDALRGFIERSRGGEDVTWPYGIDPALSFPGNRLMTALKLANRRVFKAGESRDEYTGLGTTIVAALIEDGQVMFTGVGDSRIYAFREGHLEQLTRDDSWAATLLAREPALDDKALAAHPMRHVLTNVLGAREQIDLDMDERALQGHDTFLLCSDGLHSAVDDQAIERVMAAGGPVQDITEELLRLALQSDGGDNITVLVLRVN